MSPEIVGGWVAAIVVALLTLIGSVVAVRHQKGSRENRLIDQLQEELDSVRVAQAASDADRVRERREDQARMARLEARDRVYIPHILKLNWHIEQGLGPPAPAIPELIKEFLENPEGGK